MTLWRRVWEGEKHFSESNLNQDSWWCPAGTWRSRRKLVTDPGEEAIGCKTYLGKRVHKNWYVKKAGLDHRSLGI